jgi:hypothetical protein
LPLGHAALAYLPSVGTTLLGRRRLPAKVALFPLAVGSQFPDLVDKPLAYRGVLTSGRSLAHSLFAFVLVTALVWWVGQALQDRWAVETWQHRLRSVTPSAFAVGYGSHLLGDLAGVLSSGAYADARFLLYPLSPPIVYPGDETAPLRRLLEIYREIGTHPQIDVILLAMAVFVGVQVWARWSAGSIDGKER